TPGSGSISTHYLRVGIETHSIALFRNATSPVFGLRGRARCWRACPSTLPQDFTPLTAIAGTALLVTCSIHAVPCPPESKVSTASRNIIAICSIIFIRFNTNELRLAKRQESAILKINGYLQHTILQESQIGRYFLL